MGEECALHLQKTKLVDRLTRQLEAPVKEVESRAKEGEYCEEAAIGEGDWRVIFTVPLRCPASPQEKKKGNARESDGQLYRSFVRVRHEGLDER